MAAIAPPPISAAAAPAQDELLTRFREHVVSVPGARDVSQDDVEKAFNAEVNKTGGRENLQAHIDAAKAMVSARAVKTWAHGPVIVSGNYESTATTLDIKNLHSSSIQRTNSTHVWSAFKADEGKVSGKLYYNSLADLQGKCWAKATTSVTEKGGKVTQIQLSVDWYKGDQHDEHIATFTNDLPFGSRIYQSAEGPDSTWSLLDDA